MQSQAAAADDISLSRTRQVPDFWPYDAPVKRYSIQNLRLRIIWLSSWLDCPIVYGCFSAQVQFMHSLVVGDSKDML